MDLIVSAIYLLLSFALVIEMHQGCVDYEIDSGAKLKTSRNKDLSLEKSKAG